jgi:O-antigen/teichoic acid export membrane protein
MQNRIIFKIIATGLNFLMSIVIGILVPRAIGPASYGDYSYIISTYAFFFQFLMFTSSTAYIYFLSHGKHKVEDVNMFYMIFLAFISFLVVVIGIITANSDFGIKYLWNELDNQYLLYLGLIFGIFTSLQQRLIEFSDSTSQTIISEKLKLVSRFVMVLTVVAFIFLDKLDIYWYFVLSIANFILFFILFFSYITFKVSKIEWNVFKMIFDDFYIYLKPLIIFTLIAAIYSYLGKYVLQSSSGSIEQGYYNFAYQLALIPVTFISSIMAIYMSEMTKKFKINDIAGVKEIFVNNIFKIYAIHAFIAFFMLVNTKEIILLTVGEEFLGAIGALQALSIFSLLHTFGMLSGNLFFSSGKNKEYSQIGATFMFFGIIILVCCLKYELSFTSYVLAILMTVLYSLQVTIQLYKNCKLLKISFILFLFKTLLFSVFIYYMNILINISIIKGII